MATYLPIPLPFLVRGYEGEWFYVRNLGQRTRIYQLCLDGPTALVLWHREEVLAED
jgi:hypothetical protein